MNKNYVKGRRKEYYIAEKLKKEGFDIVQRTAGSHSPFDIIAIDTNRKRISLVQCKPNTMSENERMRLLGANMFIVCDKYSVDFEVR
jgi:Holliday junction resolvase|tara:strand:- start:1967 stop:2227 length:261 start_codon:yes stop_codon:yes gene_type:complete